MKTNATLKIQDSGNETLVRDNVRARGMKVRTGLKAGRKRTARKAK